MQSPSIYAVCTSIEHFLESSNRSNKEESLIRQQRVFKYIDNWVEKHRPSVGNPTDLVEEEGDATSFDQLQTFAIMQAKYDDVKEVIRSEWFSESPDAHQYDPECEYESHILAVVCLLKCYMLDVHANAATEIKNMNTTMKDVKVLLKEWEAHLNAADAESLRYLVYGRALLKDNMHTSTQGGYYTYLYSDECQSLLNAILKVKQQYEMAILMGEAGEERQQQEYGRSSGDTMCDEIDEMQEDMEFEFAVGDDYQEPLSESHKRKRGDSDPYRRKRSRTIQHKFHKLSYCTEFALDDLVRWLTIATQHNTDLFMHVDLTL